MGRTGDPSRGLARLVSGCHQGGRITAAQHHAHHFYRRRIYPCIPYTVFLPCGIRYGLPWAEYHRLLSSHESLHRRGHRLRRCCFGALVRSFIHPLFTPLLLFNILPHCSNISYEDTNHRNARIRSQYSQAGVSRSASLVAAYMLSQCGLTSVQVLNSIKTIRPCISPNIGFRKQLQSWEHEQNGNPNAATIRRWALANVAVGGCLAQYERNTTQYILGNRIKDQAMRIGFQALLTHGSLIARTTWGQRFLAQLFGQSS